MLWVPHPASFDRDQVLFVLGSTAVTINATRRRRRRRRRRRNRKIFQMAGQVGRIVISPIEINIEPPGEVMHVASRIVRSAVLGPGRARPDQYGSVVTERPFLDILIVGGVEHRKIDNFLAVADSGGGVSKCVHIRQIVAHLLAYVATTDDLTWRRELRGGEPQWVKVKPDVFKTRRTW